MRYIPILFSTEMVKAILDNRKTQTRRICKPQPISEDVKDSVRYFKIPSWPNLCEKEFIDRLCRWSVGDVLWVREAFAPVSTFPEPDCFGKYLYKSMDDKAEKWKPGIHMPKSACRIFLQITDIRVERVQDISEEDAKAEGVILGNFPNDMYGSAFCELWTRINGAESWNANPWVWAITFNRIDKPENF